MRKLRTISATAAVVLALSYAGTAWANHLTSTSEFADQVVDSATTSTNSRAPHGALGDGTGYELNALGAPDGTGTVGWFSLGTGTTDADGFIIVEFTDNLLVPDGTGADDLNVWEAHSFGATGVDEAEVFISDDCENFTSVGTATDDPNPNAGTFANGFDLDGVGLTFVRCVKIVNAGMPTNDEGEDGFEVDSVEALSSEEIALIGVEKALVNGPNDADGDPIVVEVDPFDDGGILVSSGETQRFEFAITLTNLGDPGSAEGAKILDVVPAELDPDCDAEDGFIDDPDFSADCPADATPNLDGIDVTSGNCVATIEPHDEDRKLDPHAIEIVMGSDDVCEISVWVRTSENPASAKGNKPLQFEPTSCRDLGMGVIDTFTLNEGVKVFNDDPGDLFDIRVLGPEDSLQLTCNFL